MKFFLLHRTAIPGLHPLWISPYARAAGSLDTFSRFSSNTYNTYFEQVKSTL
jgi:hypothetical protein|eukprot:COSAG06_NODE_2538_length_6707_cov_7.401937_7_plen_52_part_00